MIASGGRNEGRRRPDGVAGAPPAAAERAALASSPTLRGVSKGDEWAKGGAGSESARAGFAPGSASSCGGAGGAGGGAGDDE
jgi:hypothetical protein